MATNINKIIKTCKPFWPASEDFVNSATVFVNSATPRGRAPAAPQSSFSFCSARKKTESKERARKRPELRGRNTNSSNHSMRSALPLGLSKNSLRSNSISYFVAQIANTIRDSMLIQRICITLKTSSCGLFSRSLATQDPLNNNPSA